MGHADGRYFYSMRFVEGPSLAEILRTGPLSNDRAARYMEPVARLLHKLHQKGIVHRDLKPKNILIDTKEDRPFVTDFGLAKSPAYAQGLTQVEACMGTPEYISPEQARNSATAREPSDIYSFGATLYELLTGRPPFRAADAWETLRQVREEEPLSPRRLNPAVHRDLELICLKCLQKEPQKRYAKALVVAEELQRYSTGQPLRHTRPVSRAERGWRWCRRNPALATASGLALAALLATAIVSACFAMYLSGVVRDKRVQTAEFALNNGLGKCAEGKIGEGMLWLARSLELAPDDAKDYDRVARTNLGSWSGMLYPLRAVLPQSEQLVAVALSVDGKTIFTATQEKALLKDPQTGNPIGPPLATPSYIACATFSPDGKLILTGCRDNSARLWEVSTGRLIGSPLYHSREASARVTAVAFSPDSKLAVTGSTDRTAKIWEVITGRAIGGPLLHKASVLSVSFSANGKRVLTGTTLPKQEPGAIWGVRTIGLLGSPLQQGPYVGIYELQTSGLRSEERTSEARLWDVATGRPLSQLLRHRLSLDAVACSSDGRFITTVAGSNAQIWDVASGKSEAELFPLQNGLSAVAFSADGKLLLTGSLDGNAQLWDVITRKPVGPRLRHRERITSVVVGADGKFLVTGSDRTVRLWEVTPPKTRILRLKHQADHVTTAAFSADGRMVATGSQEGNVQIWETATGKARDLSPKHQGWIKAIAFSPDGKRLATGAHDEGRLWDVAGGIPRAIFRYPNPLLRVVLAVAFSPDGRSLLTGVVDGNVGVWDAATGQSIGGLFGHTEAVYALAISRNGKLMVTGSEDCSAQVWDALTKQPIGPRLRQGGPILSAVFNSDGRFVLTGSTDGTAQLWDAITGQKIGPRLAHEGPVGVVAFSPDDSLLLTASRDLVQLWETSTGRRRGTALQHQGVVYSAAFSPDGRLVLTGSADTTARFWDAGTGKQCGPPLQHRNIVQAHFSPNGKTALTVGYGETPRLWDVPSRVDGSVERIVLWTNVLTGMRLDETGAVHVLDSASWKEARRHLEDLGGPPSP
jgi:WD40 repeat protein